MIRNAKKKKATNHSRNQRVQIFRNICELAENEDNFTLIASAGWRRAGALSGLRDIAYCRPGNTSATSIYSTTELLFRQPIQPDGCRRASPLLITRGCDRRGCAVFHHHFASVSTSPLQYEQAVRRKMRHSEGTARRLRGTLHPHALTTARVILA